MLPAVCPGRSPCATSGPGNGASLAAASVPAHQARRGASKHISTLAIATASSTGQRDDASAGPRCERARARNKRTLNSHPQQPQPPRARVLAGGSAGAALQQDAGKLGGRKDSSPLVWVAHAEADPERQAWRDYYQALHRSPAWDVVLVVASVLGAAKESRMGCCTGCCECRAAGSRQPCDQSIQGVENVRPAVRGRFTGFGGLELVAVVGRAAQGSGVGACGCGGGRRGFGGWSLWRCGLRRIERGVTRMAVGKGEVGADGMGAGEMWRHALRWGARLVWGRDG
eukprot:364062-Chlamydomonas_euryale.AAC.15